jgi:hypothetical protein
MHCYSAGFLNYVAVNCMPQAHIKLYVTVSTSNDFAEAGHVL